MTTGEIEASVECKNLGHQMLALATQRRRQVFCPQETHMMEDIDT